MNTTKNLFETSNFKIFNLTLDTFQLMVFEYKRHFRYECCHELEVWAQNLLKTYTEKISCGLQQNKAGTGICEEHMHWGTWKEEVEELFLFGHTSKFNDGTLVVRGKG